MRFFIRKAIFSALSFCLSQKFFLKLARRIQFAFSRTPRETVVSPDPGALKEQERSAISIWQPVSYGEEEFFQRPAPNPFGDHFSCRLKIPQSKPAGTIRVGYFGESAAAGYLYAPHLYPANHLERVLNENGQEGQFEVIDLSRTNETLDSLLETFTSSIQLRPDICVIFVGNNWSLLETPETSPHYPDVSMRQTISGIYAKNGLDGLADWVVKTRLEKAAGVMDEIRQLAEANQIKVVLVIPEVNLVDWESRQPVPFFAGNGIEKWYGLYDQAQAALVNESWAQLLDIGFEMWNLDHGTCSTTYRLIGIAQKGLGDLEKARAAFKAEIYAVILPYMTFLNAPQVTSYDQAVLRRLAGAFEFSLVDLTQVFETAAGERLPGRELFLDYCHLSKDGIEIAVSVIADEVYRLAGYAETSADCFRIEPNLSKEHQALVEFGAAIHTTHRLISVRDRKSILEYWCRKAYETSPDIASTMLELVEARLAPVPEVLTTAQQQNVLSEFKLQFSHGWKYDQLDIELIEIIRDVLAVDLPLIAEKIDNLLLQNHAVEDRKIDLISTSKYMRNPLEQSYFDLLVNDHRPSRAFFRAYWPRTEFVFISRSQKDLIVSISARIPGLKGERAVRLNVNDVQIEGGEVGSHFCGVKSTIPAEILVCGVNKLVIEWPMLEVHANDFTERMQLGHSADLTPVFGDIYSLVISTQ
jgi:hypothetical protein